MARHSAVFEIFARLPLGVAFVWGAFLAAPGPVAAQETKKTEAKGEDPDFDAAIEDFRHGDYDKADRALTTILGEEPKNLPVLRIRALLRFEMGSFDDAKTDADAVLALDPKEPRMAILLAERLERAGKYEEAIEEAKIALGSPLDRLSRMTVSRLYDAMGDEAKGESEARKATETFNTDEPKSAREWLSLASAFERLGDYETASQCCVAAEKADRAGDPLADQDALVALGNLYARVYRNADGRPNGEKEFKDILGKVTEGFRGRNPNHRGALLGRYEIGRDNYNLSGEETAACLARLLEMDPNHPQALLEKAEGFVNDRRFDDALRVIDALLAQNPRLLDAQAERAALDFLQHREESQQKAFEEDRKARPGQSRFPGVLGRHLKSLYRFADAIPFLEEAAKRNPKDGPSRTALGECYAHLGREADAKKILVEADAIEEGMNHPWRENMIQVLTGLEKEYQKVEGANFTFRFHPDDEAILREMLPNFYEETRRNYGERYGYVPKDKIQVEVFREWRDFSVRSVGFTGFGALGVCFGPLITSVSPLATAFRGHFSYLDTAWHEYAHVVHLALSRGRVPRWFTEGLATLEEVKRNPAFDRRMELDLLSARANNTIYPVLELNAAFRGPRIIFGYYQGGLLCEFLEKKTSTARLVDALKLFGEDLPLEQVIEKAFGLSVAELDRQFLAFVDEKLKSVKARPPLEASTVRRLRAKIAKNPKDAESLRALAWGYLRVGQVVDAETTLEKLRAAAPDDAEAHLVRAEILIAKKRPDLAIAEYKSGFDGGAEEFFSRLGYAAQLEKLKDFEETKKQLRAAIAAFPTFADPNRSPHVHLAKLLDDEGKVDECMALLEEFCRISGTARGPRMELASRYEAKGELASLERVLGEILEVDPYQREIQKRRAVVLLDLGKFNEAARSAKLARLVDPMREPPKPNNPNAPRAGFDSDEEKIDRAECWAIEAQALLAAKKPNEAKDALKEALRLDASNERALQVKERLETERTR